MTNVLKITVDEIVIFERGNTNAEYNSASKKHGQPKDNYPGIVWYLDSIKNRNKKEPGILENTGSCFFID